MIFSGGVSFREFSGGTRRCWGRLQGDYLGEWEEEGVLGEEEREEEREEGEY